jgi:chromosome segregation ATPase
MPFLQKHYLKLSLTGLLWLGALAAPVFAQTGNSAPPASAQEAPLTREVVNELQRLRQAVERSNLNQYRVTIAVERLRLQQELLARLSRDLESARRSLTEFETTRQMMAERLKELEQSRNTTTDPQARDNLEHEHKHLKVQAGRHEQLEQSERTRETALRSRVELEQAKLNELQERLDALEHEFEKQATTTAAPTERKRD